MRDPRAFLRSNAMPLVATLVAALSCVFVPPDADYAGYVDWGTLARIAGMLAVVGALREAGVFQALALRLVGVCHKTRGLVLALVGMTALASMFVTNDMALLAMLPLAAASLLAAGRDDLVAPTFVLQGLAANLCGMLMPFGNPQNIFLTSWFSIRLGDFLVTMAPPFATSCVLILVATLMLAGNAAVHADGPVTPTALDAGAPDKPAPMPAPAPVASEKPAPAPARQLDSMRVAVLAVLLGMCVLAVLRVVPAGAALVVVLAGIIVLDRGPHTLAHTDWGLLVTFAAFFVFSGNLARMDLVRDAFVGWLGGGALVPGALLSQVISNVPAAVVLARFTGDWQGLLVGVNVGGAGTPVGSLATLIVIAQFQGLVRRLPANRRQNLGSRGFWRLLLALNLAFLLILLVVETLLGR